MQVRGVNYIIIGMLGFVAGFLSDWVSFKGIRVAKLVMWGLSYGLILYALVMLCLTPDRIPVPGWLSFLGVAISGLSGLLLVYSLFVSLPAKTTYVTDDGGYELVRTGMYALVRHPGVLWLAFLLIGLVLATKSRLLLFALPVWMLLDVLWVILQEKFFFGRMFPDYDSYRRETPMVIPNRKSLGVFFSRLKQAKRGEANARGA